MFDDALDKQYGAGQWHCDDVLNSRSAPDCVLAFLEFARAPATVAMEMEPVELYATDPQSGKRCRVTMASRFGDVGISFNLNTVYGYDQRLFLCELSDFSSNNICEGNGDETKS